MTAARTSPGVIGPRDVLLWFAALILASVIVAALVGCVATGDEFNWDLAAVAATAFATIALAAFTASLAFTTSGDVRATWELAETARQERADRMRPVVAAYAQPSLQNQAEGRANLNVVVSNIGSAPALAIEISGMYPGATDEVPVQISGATYPLLKPGDERLVSLDVDYPRGVPGDGVTPDPHAVQLIGTCRDTTNTRYAVLTDWTAQQLLQADAR